MRETDYARRGGDDGSKRFKAFPAVADDRVDSLRLQALHNGPRFVPAPERSRAAKAPDRIRTRIVEGQIGAPTRIAEYENAVTAADEGVRKPGHIGLNAAHVGQKVLRCKKNHLTVFGVWASRQDNCGGVGG